MPLNLVINEDLEFTNLLQWHWAKQPCQKNHCLEVLCTITIKPASINNNEVCKPCWDINQIIEHERRENLNAVHPKCLEFANCDNNNNHSDTGKTCRIFSQSERKFYWFGFNLITSLRSQAATNWLKPSKFGKQHWHQ